MNNKGFTLVELLAVIALLAVILLIISPSISNILAKFRNDEHIDMLKKSAISAAKEYVTDAVAEGKITSNDISCNDKIYVSVKEILIKEKYLEIKETNELYESGKIEITYDHTSKKFGDYKFCKQVLGVDVPSTCTLECKEN